MANVLQLLSSFKVGGLEKLLVSFLKAGSNNFSVVIMNDKVDEGLKEELLKTGCKVYFLNRREGHKHPKYLFQLLKIIRENDIDIIHSHNSGGMLWAVLCKLCKTSRPKLKLVHTIHDSVILKNLGRLKFFALKTFVDMNIAISNAIFDDCAKKKLRAVKIYNGVDVACRPREPRSDRNFNIINIARITHRKKGQDVLIRALKECKDKGMQFTCSFAGGVYDEESFEYLKKLVEDSGLASEVAFLGNREDIPELLAQSDLFILPSRYEGMPVSLLEAMAAGVPVIASNISGSADLINHGENGLLFESENHLDLTGKILFLYNNRWVMCSLAKSAQEYVRGFDISVMHKKYCELYESLC